MYSTNLSVAKPYEFCMTKLKVINKPIFVCFKKIIKFHDKNPTATSKNDVYQSDRITEKVASACPLTHREKKREIE